MSKNTAIATKEQRIKAAKKAARNTIAWHGLSAIGILCLLFMFRSNLGWTIMLAAAVILEAGIVGLALLSLKTQLEEIQQEQDHTDTQ